MSGSARPQRRALPSLASAGLTRKNLVDRTSGQRDHEQVAIGSRLDVGHDTEVLADEKALAFRDLVFGQVVGDAILKPGIINGNRAAVAGQIEMEKIPAAQNWCCCTDKEISVELSSQPAPFDEADSSRRHLPLPAELGIAVNRARQ